MRIKVLDGLRAIAVMGVIWAHIWMFCGTPAGKILQFDIAKLISFFGTGVDLFFVISGFCMYLMFVSKQSGFSVKYYIDYLKKRWLRIAPAFYVAILVYGLAAVSFQVQNFELIYALKHALFIRNFFFDISHYAPHFWSLCTEWHFYIVLPLLVWAISKYSFWKVIGVSLLLCICFRLLIWIPNKDPYNIIDYSIANRLVEFLMGVMAAKLYLSKTSKWYLNSMKGLLLGVTIAFAGRLLMTAQLQERMDIIGVLSRTFNLPMLTFGYGLVLINALNFESAFSAFMRSKLMQLVGKYSYSMYLWHWIVTENLTRYMLGKWNIDGFAAVNIIFLLSMLILIPLSALSYHFLEAYYFNWQKARQASKYTSTEVAINREI